MILEKLSLINFKNYPELDIELSGKINCFIGKNGVGKTNLLDAVYYLSFCKSFLNPSDSMNIRGEEDFFVIQGKYRNEDDEENIYCGFKRGAKKQFKRNKKEYQKLADHVGLVSLVIVSPLDYGLITGGSEERRKFIDGVIAQFDRIYLDDLMNYNKALEQRNRLLKDFARSHFFDNETLDLWNENLVRYGVEIHKKRREFIDKLIPIFNKFYQYISGDAEYVSLEYSSQLDDTPFRELLESSVEKDRIVQFTTAGIHKDDLMLKLGQNNIKKIGSQGQQKTYLLSLKLAQFEYIKDLTGKNPLLLLDDVFDKLDSDRVGRLIKLVADNSFGQIFITDTSLERMQKIFVDSDIQHSIFRITAEGRAELL